MVWRALNQALAVVIEFGLLPPALFRPVGVADGAIIATLLCGEDGRRATFYHLAVAADWRGQGIARQLLARAEDRLRARGILKMRLLVLGDNALGNAYWPKQGWRQQSELNYYSKSLI